MKRVAATSGGLQSADVVSHVLHFICRPPADKEETHQYAVRLRGTSQLWSRAFGQFLELWVIPRGTEIDGAGRAIWTPHSYRSELLLVLFHLNDGLTTRLTTSFLHGLVLESLPDPIAQRLLSPRFPILAVRHLDVRCGIPPTDTLSLLEWFPNLTSLVLNRYIFWEVSDVLQLPSTLEELSLPQAPALATDLAAQLLAERFPHLRELTMPWSSKMTLASADHLLNLSSLHTVRFFAANRGSEGALDDLVALARRLGTLVKVLGLSSEKLVSLPESFGGLTGLQDLNLMCNQLVSLPESFGGLTALQQLYLMYNELTSLPESFGALTGLWQLHLMGNKLTSLPESFGGLTALQELLLNDNQLVSLPDSFGGLKSLRLLYLGSNAFASLPESLGELTALQELSLSFNKLVSLPKSLARLPCLKECNVERNYLKREALPPCVLTMPQLRGLDEQKKETDESEE